MKKKVLSLVLGVSMVASLLAGCGSKNTANTANTTETTEKTETADAEKGGKTITYWCMWESTEAQGKAISEAVAAYEAATGNKVDLQFKGRTGIREGLQPALDAGTNIDLFDEDIDRVNGTWGKYLLDLEDLVKTSGYEETANAGLMQACRDVAGGTLKSIPYQPNVYAFFYNQEIFDKAGVTAVPTTWDELLAACEKIKAAGFIPITCDDAYITCMIGYHLSRLIGEKATEDLINNGDWAENPAALQMAQAYEELASKGYFSEYIDSNVWPSGQNVELAGGQAAMYLNGSWLPNEVLETTGPDFKWGCFSYPDCGGVDGVEASNFGAQVYAINKDTKVAPEAFELIQYITKGEFDQKMSQLSTGIPADTTNTEWPTMLSAVQPVLNSLTTRYAWAAGAECNADMTPIIKGNFLKLCGGKLTAQQFIDEMEAASK
ncbi:MAG: ABC transporter substrate-binding protein [Acetivibrio sp.]